MKALLQTSTIFLIIVLCPSLFAERYALVIGNSAYQADGKLQNATNDSTAVAKVLSQAGWKVVLAEDIGIKDTLKTLRLFCEKAENAEAALFYFAGHGLQVKEENYLIPVDAKLTSEDGIDALPLETLALSKVISDFGKSNIRLKTFVLDCCRSDPFSRSWLQQRSTYSSGLAKVDRSNLPEGSMIVFSTAPGKTASDGRGSNSPFTSAFVKRLSQGNGGISDVFADVSKLLGAKQTAWIEFDGSGLSFSAFHDYPFALKTITKQAAPIISISKASLLSTPVNIETPKPTIALPKVYSFDEVFSGGPFADHGSHDKKQLLVQAQTALQSQNFYTGSIDGLMGVGTQNALLNYQKNSGITQSGRLDTSTVSLLKIKVVSNTNRKHVNSLGMNFVPISGANFWFCEHETRVRDFIEFAKSGQAAGNTSWQNVSYKGHHQTINHPVINISWHEAKAFCDWLSLKEGKRYRLPTTAEWSLAMHGDSSNRKNYTSTSSQWPPKYNTGNYSGSETASKFGSIKGYTDKFPFTAPVMSFQKSKSGLYDLNGNVMEYCLDWNSQKYVYKIARGGCWKFEHFNGEIMTPVLKSNYYGFRCVLETGN